MTEEEYEDACKKIESLMSIDKTDPRFIELCDLVYWVERYQREHYPMGEEREVEE